MTTAIAKRPTNTLEAIRREYPTDEYRLCLPETRLARLPEGFTLSVRQVTIDTALPRGARANRDVYTIAGGTLGLSKTALDRMAAAAGIKSKTRRTDPRAHPHYCEMTAECTLLDFDGTERSAEAQKTVDLRADCGDGTPGKDYAEIVSKNRNPDRQLMEARKFIAEICESKACNRAIAKLLAVPRGGTAAELAKPMIFAKLVPDPSHPLAQRATMAAAFGATQALFGPAPQAIEAEIIDETPDVESPHPSASAEEAPGVRPPNPGASDSNDYGPPPWDDIPEADPVDVRDPADVYKEAWQIYRRHGGDPNQWHPMLREIGIERGKELDSADRILKQVKQDVGL